MILRDNMGWWSGDGPGKVFTMICIIPFEWLWMVLNDLYIVCFEPFPTDWLLESGVIVLDLLSP